MSTLIDRFVPQVTKEKLGEITELPKLNYSVMDAMREGSEVSSQLTDGFAKIDECGELQICALSSSVLAATARGYMA